MYPIKQSAALTVVFFLHDANGDGVTGVVDGSFTKRISKGSGAFAAMTVTITEMENGFYSLPLSTAHSDTLGILTISLSATGAKRCNLQFRVHARLPDDLAFPTTPGNGIDVDASGGVEVGSLQAAAITAIRSIVSGTADSGTTSTMVDAARTEADADYWRGKYILFTSGNISGQCRLITAFNATTDTITFAPVTTQAVGTNTYEILPAGRGDLELVRGSTINGMISGRLDVNTQAMGTGVIAAGTFAANAIDSAALAASAVTEIQAGLSTLDAAGVRSAIGLAAANLDTQLTTIDDFLDTEVASILALVDTEIATIKTQTDQLVFSPANQLTVNALTVSDKTGYSLAADLRIKKNTALSNFLFVMRDSTDHLTPKTGLTVSAQRSLDGAAFAACANAVVEVGNGVYRINLAATDLNADTIMLRFTATGADATLISIVTQTE